MVETAEGRIISLQDREVPLQEKLTPWGRIRYLYGREDEEGGTGVKSRNQDFLAIKYDDRKIVFAVCDGVTRAWESAIAAREVAQDLVSWMWEDDLAETEEGLNEQVKWRLNQVVKPVVDRQAEEVPIPEVDPEDVLYDVLIDRKQSGSQTVFFAGKISLEPSRNRGSATLFWMGNTKGAVRHKGKWVDLAGGDWNDWNRFSSKLGMDGKLSVWMRPLKKVDRVLVHTDGLEIIDRLTGQSAPEDGSSPGDIDEMLGALTTLPEKRHDDVALLELAFNRVLAGIIQIRVAVLSSAIAVMATLTVRFGFVILGYSALLVSVAFFAWLLRVVSLRHLSQ